jgi:hypothetical protein
MHTLPKASALVGLVALLAATDGALADPCAAFTPDAHYVTSYVVRTQEGGKVRLRVPIQYFEDAWDRVDGFEDRSQLFSVDMNDFTPVTRPDTAVRNRARKYDYMWFTVNDRYGLDKVALVFARAPGDADLTELPPGRPGPAELTWLETKEASDSAYPRKDVFIARGKDGELETVIKCSSPRDPNKDFSVAVPICEHLFRASGLDVNVSYPRIFLDRWRQTQSDVQAFLACATHP